MRYYELNPEKNHFDSLVADLTHKCNMACSNCYIPNRDEPDMDVEKLYHLIKKLPKRVFIRLIGAEPTLREDLPQIIERIIKLGHKPSLTTNGLKLSSESYCQLLKAAGLKYLLISMNGAEDDDVYKILDGGKYAKLKVKALRNAFKAGFTNLNTGTIIARGVNEKTIKDQVDLVVSCAKDADIKEFNKKLPPVLRMKIIGSIGRHMDSKHIYTFEEFINLTSQFLNINTSFIKKHPVVSGSNKIESNKLQNNIKSYAFPYQTELGSIYIRLIDWTTNQNGIPDADSMKRGRITQDWTIAPFFEHIKKNEGAY